MLEVLNIRDVGLLEVHLLLQTDPSSQSPKDLAQ